MTQFKYINQLKLNLAFTALFCLLMSSSALAQVSQTILVLGDSLSAEYGLAHGTGWVGLLEKQLQKEGSPWTVFNASISGETSSGGLSRLPSLLDKKKPGLVIIELGANDGLRGLPIVASQNNLQQLIALSKYSGAKVLLIGIQLPPNYGADYTKQFASIYPKLAKTEGTALLPFFLAEIINKPELFQADRMHPNEQAQHILFKNVWGALAPYRELLKK
jgi:acyl-CoA thioesterase I